MAGSCLRSPAPGEYAAMRRNPAAVETRATNTKTRRSGGPAYPAMNRVIRDKITFPHFAGSLQADFSPQVESARGPLPSAQPEAS